MYFKHEDLHQRAMSTAKEYRRCETALIGIFQELEKYRTYEQYQMPSLFIYATKMLGLSEATTCMLTSVMRASIKVPELKTAIEEGKITLSNARRIAPVLGTANKSEWLEKAAALPLRKLELELAKAFPDRPAATRMIAKSEKLSRLEIDLPHATLAKLKRAQEILAQKKQKHIDAAQTLDAVLDEFLERHDPVEKAKRAQKRQVATKTNIADSKTRSKELAVSRPVKNLNTALTQKMSPEHLLLARKMGCKIPRIPVPARERHALALNENLHCSFSYSDGTHCKSTLWLHRHHVTSVANGGSNSATNLRTLCSAHHRIEHKG